MKYFFPNTAKIMVFLKKDNNMNVFLLLSHFSSIPIAKPCQGDNQDAPSNAIGNHMTQAKGNGRY